MVQVLNGSVNGLTNIKQQYFSQDTTGVAGDSATNEHFGHALAVGDFNTDGRDDLAVGVPGESDVNADGTPLGDVAAAGVPPRPALDTGGPGSPP